MDNLKSLIAKYERGGPRYTSYPTAPYFTPSADKDSLIDAVLRRPNPLSLYIHIPFCKTLCFFCGCSFCRWFFSPRRRLFCFACHVKSPFFILLSEINTDRR